MSPRDGHAPTWAPLSSQQTDESPVTRPRRQGAVGSAVLLVVSGLKPGKTGATNHKPRPAATEPTFGLGLWLDDCAAAF